jgi:CRISPR system Cascade subunit CasD
MANTLLLALMGPLQSWGERGRWEYRDSALTPTKSAVIGLLGCALGLDDDDELRRLASKLALGVRCDHTGTLIEDYHTVVTGVLAGTGRIKINASTKEPETVISHRQYLSDAAFLVALRGEDGLLARCAAAVRAPHWPPYLGRKSCPPARPLFEGQADFESLEAALRAWPRLVSSKDPAEEGLVAQVPASPGTGLRRSDEFESRSRRVFRPRYVRDVLVYPPNPPEEDVCTSPS